MITVNPYKRARRELGMTQKALALQCGVTPQVVCNLEVGLFYKPPISITEELPMLELEYDEWVRDTRKLHRVYFSFGPEYTFNNWNWFSYRKTVDTSFRGFCRKLVYQPSMLQEFEAKGYNRAALNKALSEVGVVRDNRTKLLYR